LVAVSITETVPGTVEIGERLRFENKFSLPAEESNISPAFEPVNPADNPEEISIHYNCSDIF
jgi:hypothetical protein